MSRFVIRSDFLFLIGKNKATTFTPHEHFVFCPFKMRHTQEIFIVFGSLQCSFIHKVFKVSSGKAGSTSCQCFQVNIFSQRSSSCMYVKNALAPFKVGSWYNHLTVKTSGTQKSGIKYVRSVGGSNKNNTFIGFKTIHFHQKLIESLFTFIMTSPKSGTTLTPHGINFVDENQTGSIFLTLGKKVTHTRSTHTHKHFHKIRA